MKYLLLFLVPLQLYAASGAVLVLNFKDIPFPATQNVNVTNSSIPVTQSGLWSMGRTWALLNTTDSITSFQGGAWTIANTVFGSTQSGTWTTGRTWNLSSAADSVTVTGSVGVTGTVAATQSGAWNVGVTSSVLPTGASTAAKQDTGNTSLASIDSKLSSLGQKTSANSAPVVLASDQSAIPVSQSGTFTVMQGNAPWSVSQSGNWSFRLQDGSGNAITSQANGIQRALDIGINVAGVQIDPRVIRALTSADVVSAVQSGSWTVQQGSAPWSVSQSGTWTTGRTWTLASGTDSVAAVQSGIWNARMQDGAGNAITSQVNGAQRTLDVGIDVGGTQVDPRSIRSLTSSDTVTVVQPTAASLNTTAVTTAGATISTSANQTNGTQKSQTVDASGNIQPAGDTNARGIFSKIGDGTNAATVKAASTAAVAADTALVVAISPNNLPIISTKTPLTANSPAAATVGVTSAQALAVNTSRKGLVIQNLSVNTVSIAFGVAAVLNSGITLYPGGVYYADEFSFSTAVVNAIASGASSVISIQEYQ